MQSTHITLHPAETTPADHPKRNWNLSVRAIDWVSSRAVRWQAAAELADPSIGIRLEGRGPTREAAIAELRRVVDDFEALADGALTAGGAR